MTATPDDLLVVALEDVEPDDLLVVAIEPPDLDVAAVAVIDEAPDGGVGPALSARHVQTVPVDTWLITHGLTFIPAGVDVRAPDGARLYPRRVVHPAIGRTRLHFTRPAAGTADLS